MRDSPVVRGVGGLEKEPELATIRRRGVIGEDEVHIILWKISAGVLRSISVSGLGF